MRVKTRIVRVSEDAWREIVTICMRRGVGQPDAFELWKEHLQRVSRDEGYRAGVLDGQRTAQPQDSAPVKVQSWRSEAKLVR